MLLTPVEPKSRNPFQSPLASCSSISVLDSQRFEWLETQFQTHKLEFDEKCSPALGVEDPRHNTDIEPVVYNVFILQAYLRFYWSSLSQHLFHYPQRL